METYGKTFDRNQKKTGIVLEKRSKSIKNRASFKVLAFMKDRRKLVKTDQKSEKGVFLDYLWKTPFEWKCRRKTWKVIGPLEFSGSAYLKNGCYWNFFAAYKTKLWRSVQKSYNPRLF